MLISCNSSANGLCVSIRYRFQLQRLSLQVHMHLFSVQSESIRTKDNIDITPFQKKNRGYPLKGLVSISSMPILKPQKKAQIPTAPSKSPLIFRFRDVSLSFLIDAAVSQHCPKSSTTTTQLRQFGGDFPLRNALELLTSRVVFQHQIIPEDGHTMLKSVTSRLLTATARVRAVKAISAKDVFHHGSDQSKDPLWA